MKIGLFVTAMLVVLVSLNNVLGVVNGTSSRYCIDNSTLYSETSFVKVKDGVASAYTFNQTTPCQYGCSNSTLTGVDCNKSTDLNDIQAVIVFIVILIVVFSLFKYLSNYLGV